MEKTKNKKTNIDTSLFKKREKSRRILNEIKESVAAKPLPKQIKKKKGFLTSPRVWN